MENKTEKPTVTRAEKTDGTKKLIRSLLEKSAFKSNDLIEEGAKLYVEKFESEEAPNSVKGRIGSVIDVMKKEGEIVYEGGRYALKKEVAEEKPAEIQEEKPKKTTKSKAKKAETAEKEEKIETPAAEEKPKKKKSVKKTKEQAESEDKNNPLPAQPLQPIAPVAPTTPEVEPQPVKEEKPKKRGRKPKAESVEKPPVVEIKAEETQPPVAEKKEEPILQEEPPKKEETKADVVDMSFLLGGAKTAKKELPAREAPKQITQKAESLAQKTEQAAPNKEEGKNAAKTPVKRVQKVERMTVKKPTRPLSADEKLQEAYLKRLRKLGGDYFEYYSVYLLERYSRLNGRRLEMLKITGGEHDGGIDGEIELTDRLGFRETIYIQAKNWNPDKGDERLWVVGETLLQQFIGACVCRQAKEGKQHCRGIFITTSRFTAEAKKILEDTADKFVGYDGADLYEAAKECGFGVIKKNGEWVLDEELLSGEKAFFKMY